MNQRVKDPDTEPIMSWSKMTVDDAILTVWPGTVVRESVLSGPQGLMNFFKTNFDIEPIIVGCVETLPDKSMYGTEVKGTGGRHDLFFFVKEPDILKFCIKRLQFGMRWWEDIYFNNREGIYPIEFRRAYPNPTA
mmetsp:Transcript_18319/g.38115  ORF Transcript_18319/g.38115 Transcript_18319/m.38115 type:complete len:135 (-) Transcript_18319:61-465(-)